LKDERSHNVKHTAAAAATASIIIVSHNPFNINFFDTLKLSRSKVTTDSRKGKTVKTRKIKTHPALALDLFLRR
jgi:hypothetical protein